MTPPLVADVDGTLTRADQSIDPAVLGALGAWDAPVVLATGKALPFPVALCQFAGLEPNVVAENGGVVLAAGTHLEHLGDRSAADAAVADLRERGHDLGWGPLDLANRWRETEIAASLEVPEAVLESVAAEHGLSVLDTGYAYHLVHPSVSKGRGLRVVAENLGLDPASFVAVGDSENDVSTFEVVGRAIAVANADAAARAAADEIASASYGDGFLEAIERFRAA